MSNKRTKLEEQIFEVRGKLHTAHVRYEIYTRMAQRHLRKADELANELTILENKELARKEKRKLSTAKQ